MPQPQVKLMVFYPPPQDTARFDADYRDHLQLLHEKMGIPQDEQPYTVTRLAAPGDAQAPFYQLFSMPFPSGEALQQALSTPEMQTVAADAVRISSGGAPIILVGSEA